MPLPCDGAPARFTAAWVDPAWVFLYLPLRTALDWVSDRMNRLQFLTIRRYLGFVFAALVALLVWVALWR